MDENSSDINNLLRLYNTNALSNLNKPLADLYLFWIGRKVYSYETHTFSFSQKKITEIKPNNDKEVSSKKTFI